MPSVNEAESVAVNTGPPKINGPGAPPAKSKPAKATVEKIYQKKTQLEHILLRPDTYIGSVERTTEHMWVFDPDTEAFVLKEISFVPGLYKIFDEILVNAADNKQRDPKMDVIRVDIDAVNNEISIYNNGMGIPVVTHKDHNMYVPTMIFGHLLTSSNYNDEEEKVTGGRNGYGAKLCNIFSTKFTVETACKEYKKAFKQTWAQNMSKSTEPKISAFSDEEFTRIVFSPDLGKFHMTVLEADTVALMSRRAYDVAASTRGVKVYLNGKKLPVKNFKDYVDLYIKDKVDDTDQPIKCVYESANPRWEVAVALSDKGFQQMSFVNSIATTKGGRHIDYITKMITDHLVDYLKKRKKITAKPLQVKNHMWLFANCLIVNPTFDSQTKEFMTLQQKSFGSKCELSEKFLTAVSTKSGVIEAVSMWTKFKEQAELKKKSAGKKTSKLKGVPKLEDANDAGGARSAYCTLILTEGDSAKSLAVAGLGVVGRDLYGVFPLKGKLLNVRDAMHKQIIENAEINNLIKILGLQYQKKYKTVDDLKTLRYGKLMIMTDQDQDGSHIKGLLINFIHANWPDLLKLPFLEEFITPIVKASKGNEVFSFYSLPEFDEWKKDKSNWNTYKIKYYKGLGTSTSKEAKEYFSDMKRHRIIFKYGGDQDDYAIVMAFGKKNADQRKEWLTSWMEECKRRRELGLPEVYLYEKQTTTVNYSDFVNKELVLYSILDNERSIPSLVDGLKPGQRKVLFACFKRNDKKEIKVAQLAGSVAEHSAYHHGEASLMETIIKLAQNFVGSNNINLLKPIGQFGTRLQGGKDAASPRYIFTQLTSLARVIFNPLDDPLLKHNIDDGQKIEPEWYIPIIPMVLVNGSEGIGTGWSTKVNNYNPREIVKNLLKMIDGEEPDPMLPWFKNFTGTIEEVDYQKCAVFGEISRLSHIKYEITELPVKVWTQTYKESVLEPLAMGTDKTPAVVSDYREYHTDTTVKFIVSVPEAKVDEVEAKGPHAFFKLQGSLTSSCMVLYDKNLVLRKYEDPRDIMKDFFEVRMELYVKRKDYLVGMLEAEACRLSNQARFIIEKCDGRLVIENKKKKEMIEELHRKGYDSDPVKAWKKVQCKLQAMNESSDSEDEEDTGELDYNYLLNMPMWSLTKEKKDQLIKQRDEKLQELNLMRSKTPADLWKDDLRVFMAELDRVEELERLDEQSSKGKMKEPKGMKRKVVLEEAFPSPHAERVRPAIDAVLKKRMEAAAARAKGEGKKRKIKKEAQGEHDEFDNLVGTNTGKSLTARLGTSPEDVIKKKKALKQTKLAFKPKKKGKDPWESDSEANGSLSEGSDMDVDVKPRERSEGGRRAAAAKVRYKFSDEEPESDAESFHSNEGVEECDRKPEHLSFNDSEMIAKPKRKKEIEISDTDSEFDLPKAKKTETQVRPTASDMFDSLMESTSSPPPAASSAPKRVVEDSDSDSDMRLLKQKEPSAPVQKVRKVAPKKSKKAEEETVKPEGAKTEKARKPDGAKKTMPKKRLVKKKSGSDSEEDMFSTKKASPKKAVKKSTGSDFEGDMFADSSVGEVAVVPRASSGRAKKPVTYNFGDDDDDEDRDDSDF